MKKLTYTIVYQSCIWILSSQCCSKTSETTFHKEITSTVLAQSTHIYFCRKLVVSAGCLSVCFFFNCFLTRYNITKQSWLSMFKACLGIAFMACGTMNRGGHWLEHYMCLPIKILLLLTNISSKLADIFIILFSTGVFPTILKIAKVVLVYKKTQSWTFQTISQFHYYPIFKRYSQMG